MNVRAGGQPKGLCTPKATAPHPPLGPIASDLPGAHVLLGEAWGVHSKVGSRQGGSSKQPGSTPHARPGEALGPQTAVCRRPHFLRGVSKPAIARACVRS